MFDDFIRLVREIYQTDQFIPLHEPCFWGREKEYLLDTIDSTFVSSVGSYVDRFEADIANYTGAKYAVATVNGTSALHTSLLIVGVESGTEVITQSLTFVATCNAIKYCGAEPVFVDVDRHNLSLSPAQLQDYLDEHAEVRNGTAWNRTTGRRIAACLPMHTFGLPAKMDELLTVCQLYNIPIVEDAAESLGSIWQGKHTGTIGKLGTISFNGNKIITTGGGGMILTNDELLAKRAKHLTTTAKLSHQWQFAHDETGFNYRMPNLNAALGVAQLETLPKLIENKRELAEIYSQWCARHAISMVNEPEGTRSNAWLNAFVLKNKAQRDAFLEHSNNQGVMTRPVWELMHYLPMYAHCHHGILENCEWLSERIVNVPSSPLKMTIKK
jgi:aminotransferase in exopolysaccharide biosynthesis